jgi:hypothetical protein
LYVFVEVVFGNSLLLLILPFTKYKTMKSTIYWSFSCSRPFGFFPQSVTVEGIVKEKVTTNPGANIQLKNTTNGTVNWLWRSLHIKVLPRSDFGSLYIGYKILNIK